MFSIAADNGKTSKLSNKSGKSSDKLSKGSDSVKKDYEKNKRKINFLPEWKDTYEWVQYSDAEGLMYCSICVKHDKKRPQVLYLDVRVFALIH